MGRRLTIHFDCMMRDAWDYQRLKEKLQKTFERHLFALMLTRTFRAYVSLDCDQTLHSQTGAVANSEQLAKLKEGVEAWNQWRKSHLLVNPDLSAADQKGVKLMEADLDRADFRGANLQRADHSQADLFR